MKSKGMVVKITGSSCIILTKDGTYHKVSLSGCTNPRVGAETAFSAFNWSDYLRPALMVASLLIIIVGATILRGIQAPQAFAYISLDINPSLELKVNKDLKVIGVRPINKDASNLVSGLKLAGTDLYSSVKTILTKSAAEGYLKPGQKNYVVSAITLEQTSADKLDYDTFTQNLEAAATSQDMDVEIVVVSTDKALHDEAGRQGISTGKWAVYQNAVASGQQITLKEVRDSSITTLVDVYKVKLVPGNSKITIKTIHIPPRKGHQTTSPDNARPDADDEKRPSKSGHDNRLDVTDTEKDKETATDRNKDKVKIKGKEPTPTDNNMNTGGSQVSPGTGQEDDNNDREKEQQHQVDKDKEENSHAKDKSDEDN